MWRPLRRLWRSCSRPPHLRAVLFWKDDAHTALRPMRRLICRCVANTDRELWALFFTSMLPEDAEARTAAIAEATEAVGAATTVLDSAIEHAASEAADEVAIDARSGVPRRLGIAS